jgi:hypothetical protein
MKFAIYQPKPEINEIVHRSNFSDLKLTPNFCDYNLVYTGELEIDTMTGLKLAFNQSSFMLRLAGYRGKPIMVGTIIVDRDTNIGHYLNPDASWTPLRLTWVELDCRGKA